MFSKLPELFSRNFAIAYFLPFTAFIAISIVVLDIYGYSSIVQRINSANNIGVLIGTTVLALLSWFGGIVLLAANRDIIRLFEGYGRINPLKIFGYVEKRRYHKLKTAKDQLYDEFSNSDDGFPDDQLIELIRLMEKLVVSFPDQERWLMPTSFGNAIRAFEVYPRIMYGFETITGWNRLLAVISEDYRGLIDDAKAYVDFWVNLGFLSLISFLFYFGLALISGAFESIWLPVTLVSVTVIAYFRATSSAIEWGDMVKASVDVYLPDLIEKLSFIVPEDSEAERELWKKFSQATLYGLPDEMPERKKKKTGNDSK